MTSVTKNVALKRSLCIIIGRMIYRVNAQDVIYLQILRYKLPEYCIEDILFNYSERNKLKIREQSTLDR